MCEQPKKKKLQETSFYLEKLKKNTHVWLYRCISNYKHFICYGGWRLQVPECGSYIFGEECPGFRTPWPLAEKRNAAILNIIACNHLCFTPSIRRAGWLLKIYLQQAQLWIRWEYLSFPLTEENKSKWQYLVKLSLFRGCLRRPSCCQKAGWTISPLGV